MEFGAQAITIGPVQIRYYGIIIVTAILLAAMIAARMAKNSGRNPDHVWGGLFWAVIFGIIGARLWYILFPPISQTIGCADTDAATVCRDAAWYLQNFFNTQDGAIAIWNGGLHIFGAFIGGGLAALGYLRFNKEPFAPWLDIAAVALPLGQAVGRIANWVNQELYGVPTGVSWWGIRIDGANRVGEYRSLVDFPPETLFHPMFAYEAVWNLLWFFLLYRLWRNRRQSLKPGTIFLLYVAQYALIRFLLEFIRVEQTLIGGVNMPQIVAGIAFVVAVVLLIPRISTLRPNTSQTATKSV